MLEIRISRIEGKSMKIIDNLPQKYIDKIINIFGKEGEEWLSNLDNIVANNIKNMV